MMEGDLYSRYLRSCEKRSIEPLSCVLEAFKGGCSSLDLSGNCISVENCKILAKTLRRGHPFTELDLSDCLIGDEGLSKLMELLRDDTQLTSINLKGNSIKSKGTAALANFLKRNLTLERVSLEWNGVGLQEIDIKLLCEAFAVNTSLRVLDLRSNHIDHTGGSHLSSVLIVNTTLEEIDMRWNNLGILGGRSLLAALKNNSALITLRVDGNNIPSDILDAISTTLSLRLSRHVMETQHRAETMHLSAQLNQLQSDAKHKVIEVLDTLDSERTAFLQTTQLSQCEIADLKAHLEERDTTIARLEAKLLEMQGALKDTLSKCEVLSKHLEETKTQASTSEEDLRHKIKELEQEILSLKEENEKDSLEFSTKERATDIKVHSLLLEAQTLESRLETAHRERDSLKEDLMSRITTLEAMLSEKEARFKDDLAQRQQTHQKDLLSCVEEWKEKEKTLTKKICESERCSANLKEELRALRLQSGEERGEAAEEKGRLQQALKLQAMKNGYLEGQIEELKNNHEVTVEALRSKISQQLSEKARMEEESKTLQHKIKTTNQELETERSDLARAKKFQKETVKELVEGKDLLQGENKLLNKSLEEEKERRTELERKRENEVEFLKSEMGQFQRKIEQQRTVIQQFQQGEQHRMSELKAALNTYFNGTPKLTDLI